MAPAFRLSACCYGNLLTMKRRAASLLRQRLQGLLQNEQAALLTTDAAPARFGATSKLPAAPKRPHDVSQSRGAAMPAVQVGPKPWDHAGH